MKAPLILLKNLGFCAFLQVALLSSCVSVRPDFLNENETKELIERDMRLMINTDFNLSQTNLDMLQLKEIPLASTSSSRFGSGSVASFFGSRWIIRVRSDDNPPCISCNGTLLSDTCGNTSVKVDTCWGISDGIPRRRVTGIDYSPNAHYSLPDSAFIGVFEPVYFDCSTIDSESKRERRECNALYAPYVKVFTSYDRRRLYIYMLNGKDSEKYHVIWVVYNGHKYYGRYLFKAGTG
jgi:hypothetical protein